MFAQILRIIDIYYNYLKKYKYIFDRLVKLVSLKRKRKANEGHRIEHILRDKLRRIFLNKTRNQRIKVNREIYTFVRKREKKNVDCKKKEYTKKNFHRRRSKMVLN